MADRLGCIWHLSAVVGYVFTVCFLKESRKWWLHVPFGITFPEPKTQCTWWVLKWCALWLPGSALAPHKKGLPQTPNLAKMFLPNGPLKRVKTFPKEGSRKGRLPNAYACFPINFLRAADPAFYPRRGRDPWLCFCSTCTQTLCCETQIMFKVFDQYEEIWGKEKGVATKYTKGESVQLQADIPKLPYFEIFYSITVKQLNVSW